MLSWWSDIALISKENRFEFYIFVLYKIAN
jgi:hypothetical protein